MAHYAAEFNRLSRFAEGIVKDEEDRAHRFQQVLTREFQYMLDNHEYLTYDHVFHAAKRLERAQPDRSTVVKRPFAPQQHQQ